jgi:hypothetical protein
VRKADKSKMKSRERNTDGSECRLSCSSGLVAASGEIAGYVGMHKLPAIVWESNVVLSAWRHGRPDGRTFMIYIGRLGYHLGCSADLAQITCLIQRCIRVSCLEQDWTGFAQNEVSREATYRHAMYGESAQVKVLIICTYMSLFLLRKRRS